MRVFCTRALRENGFSREPKLFPIREHESWRTREEQTGFLNAAVFALRLAPFSFFQIFFLVVPVGWV